MIDGLGGQTTGEWTLGIALALDHKQVYSQSFSSRSIFVAEPSASMIQGAPLRSLQINPATLEVGHITGFGLDAADARYRLELVDQVLRLEQGDRSSHTPERRYALDLQSWVPKLTESR